MRRGSGWPSGPYLYIADRARCRCFGTPPRLLPPRSIRTPQMDRELFLWPKEATPALYFLERLEALARDVERSHARLEGWGWIEFRPQRDAPRMAAEPLRFPICASYPGLGRRAGGEG